MTDRSAIAHITWPDGHPENLEVSIHPDGPLWVTAEAVLATVADHGHIVMAGPATRLLGGEETKLEYLVYVEIEDGYSLLWHHQFTFARRRWATEPIAPLLEVIPCG